MPIRKNQMKEAGPELVLALVGALGADLQELTDLLVSSTLFDVGYRSHVIRVSSLLHEIKKYEKLPNKPA